MLLLLNYMARLLQSCQLHPVNMVLISPLSASPQMIPYSLLYSTSLSYSPTPASNPTILRTSPAVIPIECHYLRKDNVSSRAIKLTWVPFSSTLSVERLDFSLHLMNDLHHLPFECHLS
ncbi:zona pellucida sperm-binding protein 3-like [Mauremys mutica]|uniref:zona pellucida sperm-binding protein 3-like n=1 Tax=Mauremys mutica TaxID=74926 RepID=UPI001D15D94C|nr:zona pellucida sperm-binding protein 3-like [Mauremys mutica]